MVYDAMMPKVRQQFVIAASDCYRRSTTIRSLDLDGSAHTLGTATGKDDVIIVVRMDRQMSL